MSQNKEISMDAKRYSDGLSHNALCPNCGGNFVRVFDSRLGAHGQTRRRRKCSSCDAKWTTIEVPVDRINELQRIEKIAVKMVETLTGRPLPSSQISLINSMLVTEPTKENANVR